MCVLIFTVIDVCLSKHSHERGWMDRLALWGWIVSVWGQACSRVVSKNWGSYTECRRPALPICPTVTHNVRKRAREMLQYIACAPVVVFTFISLFQVTYK